MNSGNTGAIIVDSNKEEIEKLREKWVSINKVSTTVSSLATSGFKVSLLSPFDFEGPVIEIVTAVVAAVGFVGKKYLWLN